MTAFEALRLRVPGGWLKDRICCEDDGLPWEDIDLTNLDGSRGRAWIDFFCGV